MRGHRIAQLCIGITCVTAGATLGAVLPRTTATAAGPILTASPASDIADGQFVKVTFSGFAPTIGIAFRQCIPSPVTVATDCTPQNQQVTGITDGTGAGNVYLPISAGKLTAAGKTGTIQCDLAHPCVIAAMTSLNDLTTAVFTTTTFARSKDDCPPPPADALLGSGSSDAYRAIYYWESTACTAPTNVSVGYTLGNSPDGIANFFNGLTDFAVTGPFATLPTPITPPTPPLTYKVAPLTASAVVLAYRMYDNSGPQIVSLTLTPDLIARIFLGKIPNWAANAEIRALNPGVAFPTRIVPFVRAEHSAQSRVFTSWLAANAPATWTTPPSDIFPIPAVTTQGVTGSTGLGLAVADPLTDWLGQGNIGVMDSSTAAFYGLPTVTIKRADGTLMNATPQAITQAIVDATANPDGTLALKYDDPNKLAYQMAIPTYMMVPTNTISPARGGALASFLRYAVQNQASPPLPPGYAPLPPSLVQQSVTVASAIPAPPPPTPAPSPTPKPTPAATPTPTATAVPPTATPLPQAPLLQQAPLAYLPPPLIVTQPLPTAAPSPTATPCASPAPAGGTPCPPATGSGSTDTHPTAISTGTSGFTQLGDAQFGRYLLPLILGLALLGVSAGCAVEIVARRRVPIEADAQ